MNQHAHYDVLIIGSGPSGQRAAIQAAKLGKKVAIIDKGRELGGVWSNTGTIPSKSFREAVIFLSGYREQTIYGSPYSIKTDISMQDLTHRIASIIQHENNVIEHQLRRNHVEIIRGMASFINPNSLLIEGENYVSTKTADYIVIAVGTKPYHPENFDYDGVRILDSDDILVIRELPRSMVIVGGGIIGIEYASIFALMGVEITLVEAKDEILDFVDREIVEALKVQMRNLGITMRLREKVSSVKYKENNKIKTTLHSGKRIISDVVMISAGRQGAIEDLKLDLAGIEADKYGRIKVNENFQTKIENIYAVGDIVGYPALASTAMRQGRLAASHAFGIQDEILSIPLPYGIYTIPEISMVGETEASLTEKQIPYETGISRYREIARGQMIGDSRGVLKIIFHLETKQLLGVHIIGTNSTEIIHVGQSVLHLGGGLDYLKEVVFNHPTLSECYSVAALDGLNKIRE